jgi:hypothetical protein
LLRQFKWYASAIHIAEVGDGGDLLGKSKPPHPKAMPPMPLTVGRIQILGMRKL